jgi:Fic/DOC family
MAGCQVNRKLLRSLVYEQRESYRIGTVFPERIASTMMDGPRLGGDFAFEDHDREALCLPEGADFKVCGERYDHNISGPVARFLAEAPWFLTCPAHIAAVHGLQFQGIYRTAGRLAERERPHGARPDRIGPELTLLGGQIAHLKDCVASSNFPWPWIRLSAFYHARLEAIQPFGNGNGELGRTLLAHAMSPLARFFPTKEHIAKGEYEESLIHAARTNDLSPLSDVIGRAFCGLREPAYYLPSPFYIQPLASERATTRSADLATTQIDDPEILLSSRTPLNRRWFGGATVEMLERFVGPLTAESRSDLEEMLHRMSGQRIHVGEAVVRAMSLPIGTGSAATSGLVRFTMELLKAWYGALTRKDESRLARSIETSARSGTPDKDIDSLASELQARWSEQIDFSDERPSPIEPDTLHRVLDGYRPG